MNFKQWLMELDEPGVTSGEPRISQRQIAATKGAKEAAGKVLQKDPTIAGKLSAGGQVAKKVQADVSSQVANSIGKNASQGTDSMKAAFSGVDNVIGDIEKTIDTPNMMKKMMKK
jgi:hypothetical protein